MPDWLKRTWAPLAQTAAWLLSILAVFVADPPRLWPDAQADAGLMPFVRFLLAMLSGLMFLAFSRWMSRRSVAGWATLSVAGLLAGTALFFLYMDAYARWTCPYDGGAPMAMGTTMFPDAAAHLRSNPGYTCKELIQDSIGRTNTIWPEREILNHHHALGAGFAGVCLLFAVAVMALIQALRCAKPSRGRQGGRRT